MITSLKRIIRLGWIGFSRNSGLSVATVFVLVMILSLVTSLFLFQEAVRYVTQTLQERVDIGVYFEPDSAEEDILVLKEKVGELSEVKSVSYVSREEALDKFTKRHKEDSVIMGSLEELGVNPLYASLNITTWQAAQYAGVVNFLNRDSSQSLIAKIDYSQKKPVIERLFSVTSGINNTGLIFSAILAFVAILIVFNTVRLTIYNSREEIKVMRLVGASNWFIQGPFVVQGMIAGFFATLITTLIFITALLFLAPKIEIFAPGLNLMGFFFANFFVIFLLQLVVGAGIGVFSSLIAIRKYLKI